jgi:Recombination endonuclease VII
VNYKVHAYGLCRKCYGTIRSNGDMHMYSGKPNAQCSIAGCAGNVVARGLCTKHWRATRAKEEPLYARWVAAKTRMAREGKRIHPRWEDFSHFKEDVGQAPSSLHRLHIVDKGKDFGPGNFEWVAYEDMYLLKMGRIPQDVAKNDKDRFRNDFRKNRKLKHCGLSPEEYSKFVADHGGVCEICKRPETTLGKTGRIRALSIDHDHLTGALRGLLCHKCNLALGALEDNPEAVVSMLRYLKKYHPDRFADFV